jgi:hypothetical protein
MDHYSTANQYRLFVKCDASCLHTEHQQGRQAQVRLRKAMRHTAPEVGVSNKHAARSHATLKALREDSLETEIRKNNLALAMLLPQCP